MSKRKQHAPEFKSKEAQKCNGLTPKDVSEPARRFGVHLLPAGVCKRTPRSTMVSH